MQINHQVQPTAPVSRPTQTTAPASPTPSSPAPSSPPVQTRGRSSAMIGQQPQIGSGESLKALKVLIGSTPSAEIQTRATQLGRFERFKNFIGNLFTSSATLQTRQQVATLRQNAQGFLDEATALRATGNTERAERLVEKARNANAHAELLTAPRSGSLNPDQREALAQLNSNPDGCRVLKQLGFMPQAEIASAVGNPSAFAREKASSSDFEGCLSARQIGALSPLQQQQIMDHVSEALRTELAPNPSKRDDVMSVISRPQENALLQRYAKANYIDENTDFLARAYQIMQQNPPNMSQVTSLLRERADPASQMVTINIKAKMTEFCTEALASGNPTALMRALYAAVVEVKTGFANDAYARFLGDPQVRQELTALRT